MIFKFSQIIGLQKTFAITVVEGCFCEFLPAKSFAPAKGFLSAKALDRVSKALDKLSKGQDRVSKGLVETAKG